MTVRIVRNGVHSKAECQEVMAKLGEDMAMLACALEMIRSGDNSAVELLKEYLREKIKIMDSQCMQAEIVMRLSFMKQGYEHFQTLLKEIEKAGEN